MKSAHAPLKCGEPPKVCGVFSSYRVAQVIVAEDAVSIRFGSPQRVSLRSVENPCAEPTSNIVSISVGRYSSADAEKRTVKPQDLLSECVDQSRVRVSRPPRNCSSDVLRTGRAFAGRENQLSSISRHCSGVLPCCRQFDHRTWGWFGGFVTVGVLVVVRGVPAVGGASVIPASARGSGKVIPSELVHVVPSQDPPLAVISLTRLIAAGPAHSSVQPYVPSVNAVFGPGEVQ